VRKTKKNQKTKKPKKNQKTEKIDKKQCGINEIHHDKGS
jgi:hypothetical protein